MILTYFLIAVLAIIPTQAQGNQPMFDTYFFDQTMRIDYFHIGDTKSEMATLDQVYVYGTWAGSLTRLVDSFNQGKYYHKIYDSASGELVYSKGFDSYFGEYQTSAKAGQGIKRSFHESAIIPAPRGKIRFVLERRDKQQQLHEVFSAEIDPADVMIIRDPVTDPQVKVFRPVNNGDPHNKVDVVILGEGYSAAEEQKFVADLEHFSEVFFREEPYTSRRSDFNIYGVFKPSAQSGVDEPRHGSFKRTVLNATFNSLGSERYLLTEDNRAVRDLAAHVPYDAIYIMVNHDRYGGGGIYNFFCTFTTGNQFRDYLFIHEFGHSFAGLADEYYTSDVAYSDFYPKGIEPLEPNITALLDPENLKWKHLLTPGIELPTPWEKTEYDTLDYRWQSWRRKMNNKIAELTRTHASAEEIEQARAEYARRDREHTAEMHRYLRNSKFWGKIGAYEGAGYASKGLYRSELDCIMFSKGTDHFCRVCQEAISRVIDSYCQ